MDISPPPKVKDQPKKRGGQPEVISVSQFEVGLRLCCPSIRSQRKAKRFLYFTPLPRPRSQGR